MSAHGVAHKLSLGPYRQIIERDLFQGQKANLQVLLGRANVTDPRGKNVEVGIAPYRINLSGWEVWHFAIGGFDFYVKTDARPFPPSWVPFLLNDNDPVTLPLVDPLALHQIPKFQPIFQNMLKKH